MVVVKVLDPRSYEGRRAGMDRRELIIDDLKMLQGLPPHDGGGNHCRGDGYFARSLEKEYGKTVGELEREVGWAGIVNQWEAARRLFLGGGR